MPPSPQTTRLQSTLRLLIPRLRLLQKKDNASSVAQRRELAQLLDSGREASARIRVENVIANDIAVEVMEMVELYCELLLARAGVLDQIAFGEKGTRARIRAKESVSASGGGVGGGDELHRSRDGSSLGLGFSSPFGSKSTSTTTSLSPSKMGAQAEAIRDETVDEEEEYIDPVLDEAAAAIFYSWPRFPKEVRELTTLRGLLVDRWGKDFAALAQDNKATIKAPERLVKRLRVRPPSAELVESYLREIAKAYGVAWPKEEIPAGVGVPPAYPNDAAKPSKDNKTDNNDDTGDVAARTENTAPKTQSSSDQPQAPSTPRRPNVVDLRRESEAEELSRATPPRDIGPHDATGKSPVSVAPPAPRSDNPNPRVRIPGEQDNLPPPYSQPTAKPTLTTNAAADRKESSSGGGGGRIPEVDELSKRFAALKR